ncbi:MAG: HDIG domain-containing protein [Proteobacteria bacterium]|nr:HDIG domain-containing protein [Pseudomonadota bacterium]
MSTWFEEHRTAVHLGILGLVIIFASIVMLIGYEGSTDVPPEIGVGQPAPQDFNANATTSAIPDPEKTAKEKELAAENVPAPFTIVSSTSQRVINTINSFFTDLDDGAFKPVEEPADVTVPNLVGLSGADAEKAASDAGLVPEIGSTVDTEDPEKEGTIASQLPRANSTVKEGATINLFIFRIVDPSTTTTTVPPTTTTTLPEAATRPRFSVEEQVAELSKVHAVIGVDIITDFVELHEKDLDRVAEGESSVFPDMQRTAIGWAEDELTAGIRANDLNDVQQKYLNPTTRPPMVIVGIPEEDIEMTHEAMATLVARRLQSNEDIDRVQWEIDRQAARDGVPDQTTRFSIGDPIASEGEILDSVQVAAITELKLYEPEIVIVAPAWALAAFGAISILIFAFLMYRIAPKNTRRTRDIVLLAIILGIAALASRVPGFVTSADNHSIGYIVPAVAVGVMASILFDQRTALLLAIPMAGFTAIATTDLTFTVYAGIAAAIPVAFVSSVSTRSQLRLSVLGSAAVVAPVAAGLEFLFWYNSPAGSPWLAAVWAFVGAVIGGFLAQGLVSFMETAFGVTTTMSLLDLLDRNHPALQTLEEKAPGTFNHSMLVGSLAGRAARSIGADPLLAQAAAWYHDLGKTENPQYFVENQLGYNPHDELTPLESAEIIRGHVNDGLELARQFRIPDTVASGIQMHHGTSLMRYFYHKALTEDEAVDPELFRHNGVKPTRKEMAIVMISDATEAAARAYAQQEQPTEEGLAKLVDAIVSEKLEDGQFDDSSLTFGELTTIKREIVSGLSAYYHARVEYPDFPTGEQDALPAPADAETEQSDEAVDDGDDPVLPKSSDTVEAT